MITLMIGKTRGQNAPVRGLYIDGDLVTTFCGLTTARDLRTQLLMRCGINKNLSDADERLEGAYEKSYCDIDRVTNFPRVLPTAQPTGPTPQATFAEQISAPDAAATAHAVEGAEIAQVEVITTLTPQEKAKITRAKNKAKKEAAALKKAAKAA